MQYIYFGTVFAAMLIFLLVAVLLLMQRKRGERSRTILAGMTLLSVVNYISMIVYFYKDPAYTLGAILSVPFLLMGISVITIYIMYPIEVISPGWITWKRLLKMYLPATGLWLFYYLTSWLGVEYTAYSTFGQMMTDVWSFQVIFRIVLALLIFLPVVLLYYVPYTRRYNNADHKWMRGYIVVITINMASYLIVNVHDTFLSCSIYIIISILCSLYITYQELYVRLIRHSTIEIEPEPAAEPLLVSAPVPVPASAPELEADTTPPNVRNSRETELYERLEKYMNSAHAWREPDLSVEKLASVLCTNRTSLLKIIQRYGYAGYTSYVNGKRVEEFIQIVNRQGGFNYQQIFFDVGFRSKTTALRNFKQITGVIPSEYFQKQVQGE